VAGGSGNVPGTGGTGGAGGAGGQGGWSLTHPPINGAPGASVRFRNDGQPGKDGQSGTIKINGVQKWPPP
jgi:hypothetical protein